MYNHRPCGERPDLRGPVLNTTIPPYREGYPQKLRSVVVTPPTGQECIARIKGRTSPQLRLHQAGREPTHPRNISDPPVLIAATITERSTLRDYHQTLVLMIHLPSQLGFPATEAPADRRSLVWVSATPYAYNGIRAAAALCSGGVKFPRMGIRTTTEPKVVTASGEFGYPPFALCGINKADPVHLQDEPSQLGPTTADKVWGSQVDGRRESGVPWYPRVWSTCPKLPRSWQFDLVQTGCPSSFSST